MGCADRVPEQRWARLFADGANDLLLLMTRLPRETRLIKRLVSLLPWHEAVDPHRHRPSLIYAEPHLPAPAGTVEHHDPLPA